MRDVAALHLLDGRPWSQSPWVDPLSLLGCYTSFAVGPDGTVVDLEAHLARLERDSVLLLGREVDRGEVVRLALAHVEQVGAPTRLRVAVLAETPPVQPQQVRAVHVATSSRPLVVADTRAWSVRTVQHVRAAAQAKGVDPFVQLHLKRQARLEGDDDALLARGDDLLEGTTWGLVAVTRGALVVPGHDVLPSIGAARVASVAGLPVEHRPVRRDELTGLRVLLATTALTPVTPIAAVDGTAVAVDLELVARLRADCAALVGRPLG